MGKFIAYGVSVRNTKKGEIKIDESQNIPMQELVSMGYSGNDIAIDIVRSVDWERPVLDRIISEFSSEDKIVLYSINTLFKGRNNRGVEYYTKILNKGIQLLIYDFSGNVARISKYSTVSHFGERYQFDADRLIEELQNDAPNLSAIVGKRVVEDLDFRKALWEQPDDDGPITNMRAKSFIDIYFAYEAYQIKFDIVEELLKRYCGIMTKVTFWRVAADFERTVNYSDKLKKFVKENGTTILGYPKRCGGVPSEYYEIKDLVAQDTADISPHEKICNAIEALRLQISAEVYYRWQLAEGKAKRPRGLPDKDKEKDKEKKKKAAIEKFGKNHSLYMPSTQNNKKESDS